MSLSEFFHMGGYAFYVWTSYALALVVLAMNWVSPGIREKSLYKEITRRIRRAEKTHNARN